MQNKIKLKFSPKGINLNFAGVFFILIFDEGGGDNVDN